MVNYKPRASVPYTIGGVTRFLNNEEQENFHMLYYPHATIGTVKSLLEKPLIPSVGILWNSTLLAYKIVGIKMWNSAIQTQLTLGATNTADGGTELPIIDINAPAGYSERPYDLQCDLERKYINSNPTLTTTVLIEVDLIITEVI